jgi:Trypsin
MKNRRSRAFLVPSFLFVLAALASACLDQAPPADVGESSSMLLGGTASPASQNSVVLVAGADGYCSGTLIAPNLVLTAHHCVTEIGESRFHIPGPCQPYETTDIDVTTLHVRTGPKALSSKAPIAANVVKSFHDPNADVMCGNDLALILLDRSLDLPVSPLSAVSPRIGDLAYAVGYGFTSDGDTEPSARQQLHGIVLLDVAPIDEADGGELGVSSPPPSGIDGIAGLANGEIETGASICGGDSGGPLFDADGAIIGTTSRTTFPGACADVDGGETVGAVFSGVAAHLPLIQEALAAAAAAAASK